ncbi:hypothetical protein L873DRAFT_1696939, partial [Choiromyces venosus 120613-1]
FWLEYYERFGWTRVVEDGASGHQRFSRKGRKKNEVDILSWAPQSPDLNLIENI